MEQSQRGPTRRARFDRFQPVGLWRWVTAPGRQWPDFVIIGAQRSGTTSLFDWLGDHPAVTPAYTKEIHYFDMQYVKGPHWYRGHFPPVLPKHVSGEATPYLMFHPLAPERAARDLPSTTKFVAMLREPTDRAISHYWFNKREGKEPESLGRALDLEPDRLALEFPRVARGELSVAHRQYAYVSRGEYASQLSRWISAVGRDRLLVVESEQVWRDPAVQSGILEFLGLTPFARPMLTTNTAPRDSETDAEIVARLQRHFEPHNEKLFALLERELWKDLPDSPDR